MITYTTTSTSLVFKNNIIPFLIFKVFYYFLLFLLFYFSYSPTKKRFYFITSCISFIFLITTFFITYNQYVKSKNNIEAIIYVEKTEIKNAPTFNAEEVFTLHEGTKVKVLDEIDNWKKIKLADGKIGWIISNELKLLSDF